jgi:hypothetical protein
MMARTEYEMNGLPLFQSTSRYLPAETEETNVNSKKVWLMPWPRSN